MSQEEMKVMLPEEGMGAEQENRNRCALHNLETEKSLPFHLFLFKVSYSCRNNKHFSFPTSDLNLNLLR